VVIAFGDAGAVHLDAAGASGLEPCEQPQKRGLPGAVRPKHREALTRRQLQPLDLEHLARATAVAQIEQLQDCAHAAARCWTEVSSALIANASASSTPA
jgi:hypothetical protein